MDDEIPRLHNEHKNRIFTCTGKNAREFRADALSKIPEYSYLVSSPNRKEVSLSIIDAWGDPEKEQEVRSWLYGLGIPYSKEVYLLYDNQVVRTEWKILVKYWDCFANNVGMVMVVVDSSWSWACEFHHEDVISFYDYSKNT